MRLCQAATAMTHGDRTPERWPASPPWSAEWRLWLATLVVVLLLALWWSVRQLTTIVVSAVLLAYLLDPLIRRARRELGLRRAHATLLVYAAFALLLGALAVAVAPTMARGVLSLDTTTWQLASEELVDRVPRDMTVFQHRLDLGPVVLAVQRQMESIQSVLLGRESIVWLLGFATDFAFTLLGVFFTLVLSIYIAMDADKTMDWLARKVPSEYHPAYHAVRCEIGAVWQAFFRGQLVLVAVIAASTTAGLLALGVEYALALGLIAGALEVVPRVGPTLSLIPALVISATRPSTVMPDLPRAWFVLAVVALYIVIQQAENNILVPRVIGARVNLPAAVVLVGALVGFSLAGIVGVLLAPPVIGSFRVLGSWLFSKTFADGRQPPPGNGPPHDAGPGPPRCGSQAAPDGETDDATNAGGQTPPGVPPESAGFMHVSSSSLLASSPVL